MLYPGHINLKDKNVIVIGGGAVAERKIRQLLSSGAVVACVAPRIRGRLKALKKVRFINDYFDIKYIKKLKPFLVVNASGDKNVDIEMLRLLENRHFLYNSADNPHACNFFAPAVINKKDLIISISTQGRSPFMAAYIKKELSERICGEWAGLVGVIGSIRRKLNNTGLPRKRKLEIYDYTVKDKIILKALRAGDRKLLNSEIGRIMKRFAD